MAITTKGVLDWILYKQGDSYHEILIEFIKQFITTKKNKLILMDNTSCHRNQKVKNYIKEIGNVLSYHHFQNSIDNFFNQLKYYMQKYELMSYDLIKESIKNIKVINHFKSSLTKTKKYIA